MIPNTPPSYARCISIAKPSIKIITIGNTLKGKFIKYFIALLIYVNLNLTQPILYI